MFLAAASLVIGSCWIHALNFVFASEEVQKLAQELGVPESYIPVGSGVFGYKAAASPEARPRREGTVTIIK